MGPKINLTFLLVIFSFIAHTFAAVHFPFENRNPEEDYRNSRRASVHRGLFLSYSSFEKNAICRDLFSEYIEENSVISDDLKNADQQHPLTVGIISQFVGRYWLEGTVEDIFFKCSGKNLAAGKSADIEYFVSSTFWHGILYDNAHEYNPENKIGVMVNAYAGMSPEFSSLQPTQLEKQYATSRRIMKTLENESPSYVKLIEKRDDISALSTWQRFLLCSSIILSPAHESDREKFLLDWINYTKNTKKGIDQYQQKELKIKNDNNEEETWLADCLYCVPSTQADHHPSSLNTNLLLTRSFNDKHALYVLIEDNQVIRFKEYVENVPMLMNAHAPFTNDPEHIHNSELK